MAMGPAGEAIWDALDSARHAPDWQTAIDRLKVPMIELARRVDDLDERERDLDARVAKLGLPREESE